MNQYSLLDSATFTPDLLESPSAWLGHLPFASWIINEISPTIFVELGTHYGHSYFSFCQSVVENRLPTKCYAVDTWQGDAHAGQYSDKIFSGVNAYNRDRYSDFSQLMRMTFDDAVNNFANESIELLHIDGLHTYEAVRHDFETWLPKLAPGAVVIFHDTNVRERNFGVWRLWEELQARYPGNLEFVHSHGLGVLQLNNASDNEKLKWLQFNSPEKQRLINYFASIGSRQIERFELNEQKQHATSLIQTVAERERQIAELNSQINSLQNSTSWRITKPLRIAVHQIKRIRRISQLVMAAIKRGGGMKSSIKKVTQLYKREGLVGIKRAIRSKNYNINDYSEWVRRYDTLSNESRLNMLTRIDAFTHKPLISVLMPTYNPKLEWLIEAIESVKKQIYPHWELCIADDASTNKEIRPILERYAKEDSRIKIVFREENGHISLASNSAFELVRGMWMALLDHDDLLSEHALYWVADAINCNPDARLIYSDEDKIDEVGKRFDPYFKCDWNLDLFYSHNLITHLGVYRTDLVEKIEGFRVGFEGSQDYDLALRCIEYIEPNQIHHIPRVLYHWRVHADSTSKSADAKPYAMLAGEKSLNQHFQRKNIRAKAELIGHGYRVRYALPDILPMVSLIIPTRNGLHLIRRCVESILKKTTYPNYEILIVDNDSDDPLILSYFNQLKEKERIRVVHDGRPFNYSAINNAAVKLAYGQVIGLLNNDLEVISPGWLTEMVSIALQPGVGAVGAKLLYPDNSIQHAGVVLGIGGWAGHSHKGFSRESYGYVGRASLVSSFSAVTAACLVIQRSTFELLKGLNEDDLKVACNDVDFCLRLLDAGYRNVWTPYAELYHHESATRGFEDTPEKIARFAQELKYMQKHWAFIIANDPCYSPNLTLQAEDFSLAWPPRIDKEKNEYFR